MVLTLVNESARADPKSVAEAGESVAVTYYVGTVWPHGLSKVVFCLANDYAVVAGPPKAVGGESSQSSWAVGGIAEGPRTSEGTAPDDDTVAAGY